MSKHVEVTYLDGPPMLSSIDERTPSKVNGYGNIAELRQRGYTVTPLVAMTPERVAALLALLDFVDYYIGEGYSMDDMEPHAETVRAMLAGQEATDER